MFEKEDVNFKDIINLLNEISNDEDKRTSLLSSIKDIANIYYKINSALNMPKETFQSILAVINISINPFIARESYYKMLSKSDFDITMIGKEKTAVFILNKNNSKMKFYTILINQIFDIMANSNTSKTINMIIDDADIIYPFDNINDIFYKASLNNIRISMIISSLQLLKNSYEGENIDAFESFFDIIIYLCTNDVFTLNKVSLLCGNKDKDTPLITPEELKVLSNNEAVILISRLHPFKIKLDY